VLGRKVDKEILLDVAEPFRVPFQNYLGVAELFRVPQLGSQKTSATTGNTSRIFELGRILNKSENGED